MPGIPPSAHLTTVSPSDVVGYPPAACCDEKLAHGTPEHRLSDPVEHVGYTGRLYREPGKLTSSWGNDQSFWPTLESFHRMLNDCGFPVVLTAEPWVKSSRGVFVALP